MKVKLISAVLVILIALFAFNRLTSKPPEQMAQRSKSASVLTIPKIGVHAPIVYATSTNEAQFQKSLESGVVHYPNTAAPGQPGNSVLFGHSSEDQNIPGDYKFIFVLLPKLEVGDKIGVTYGGKQFTYQVTNTKVVPPTDISVLNPTKGSTLTLICCVPIGTSQSRLIVTAEKV